MGKNPHIIAHQYSSQHRKQVLKSKLCGCFYCFEIFEPIIIDEWVDENDAGVGQTALCSKCGIDSVIGSECGYPTFWAKLRKFKAVS